MNESAFNRRAEKIRAALTPVNHRVTISTRWGSNPALPTPDGVTLVKTAWGTPKVDRPSQGRDS